MSGHEPIRVVIADDQSLVRAGLRTILEAEPDIDVVGAVADGRAAVELAERVHPDLVLLDIRMPVMDGVAATRAILAGPASATRVVVLTTFDLDEYVYAALRAGASGFLVKDIADDDLVAGVRAVAQGETLFAPSVTRRLVAAYVSRAPAGVSTPGVASLTAREREVWRLMAAGLSNAEIAGRLFLGEATVKTHVSRVMTKIGARDRVQAVLLAYENGLVT
jgi:DNA-binding NarL/FixJ family response regulator